MSNDKKIENKQTKPIEKPSFLRALTPEELIMVSGGAKPGNVQY